MANQTDLFIFQVEKHRDYEPNVVSILVPHSLSKEFDILHKKWEASPLNENGYLPKWGKMIRLFSFEGIKKVQVYSDDIQPISFADWANMIVNQLSEHMGDEDEVLSTDLEEELIFFIGEFTLLRDGSI